MASSVKRETYLDRDAVTGFGLGGEERAVDFANQVVGSVRLQLLI